MDKGEGFKKYSTKSAIIPSVILVFMGTIDCITTVIGILYYGAAEINPIMASVAGNVPLFMTIKLVATLSIAGTYLLANKILNSTPDKNTKSFRYGKVFMKTSYTGLIIFLSAVVINNFMVLLA
jgi:UPF0716 family protein affecting phage T7 exclusion